MPLDLLFQGDVIISQINDHPMTWSESEYVVAVHQLCTVASIEGTFGHATYLDRCANNNPMARLVISEFGKEDQNPY